MALYGQTYTGKVLYYRLYIICHLGNFLSMSNDQLNLISLTDLMIRNVENVTPARYSILHIDEAMNDIISLIILNNYIIIIIYYLTSKFPKIFVVSN